MIDFSGLKTALKKFNNNGKYTKNKNWCIVSGGYDLEFEIKYNNNVVLQCIGGDLHAVNSFSDFDNDDLQQVIAYVMNSYEDLTIYDFDAFLEWACSYVDDITTEETLKEYGISKIEDDNFSVGLHVLNAIFENPYNTEYYRYDYNMGTLDTPTPITEYDDISDLIFID